MSEIEERFLAIIGQPIVDPLDVQQPPEEKPLLNHHSAGHSQNNIDQSDINCNDDSSHPAAVQPTDPSAFTPELGPNRKRKATDESLKDNYMKNSATLIAQLETMNRHSSEISTSLKSISHSLSMRNEIELFKLKHLHKIEFKSENNS